MCCIAVIRGRDAGVSHFGRSASNEWQEAEEVPGIADNLLLPPGTEEFIAKHRNR
ncbi:MAG: hypothetical protein ABIT20_07470 [Gemmatimonadaceae bacterium]